MGAAVINFTGLARGGFALVEQGFGGAVQGVGKHGGLGITVGVGKVAQGLGQCQELTQRIPAQVVLLHQLLDVLRGGATGTSFKQATASHQGNH